MHYIDLLPLIAVVFMFLSFFPLILRIIKNKSSLGTSSFMMTLGLLQCFFYIIHDIYFQRYVMAFSFTVLGILFLISLILIIKYREGNING